MRLFVLLVFCIGVSASRLWKKGVVHFAINPKDYDVHSQDIILSTFRQLQNDICIKFFNVPLNHNNSNDRILYINNPNKLKGCSPNIYDYNNTILDMPIGYKCLNEKDIARITVDMLRASVGNTAPVNSFDLLRKYQERDKNNTSQLISQIDRNYINAHYNEECISISQNVQRRSDGDTENANSLQLSYKNVEYYNNKIWPLAIVLYGVQEDLRNTYNFEMLQEAMAMIQLETCIVFQEVKDDSVIRPRSLIWFGTDGKDIPSLGWTDEGEKINLTAMVVGAPGHVAHVYNNLFRMLGVGMMSNRYDRDNYVVVYWQNILTGNEHLFEKLPEDAWLVQIPYDFDSITHAPANYLCSECDLGGTTVEPIQDNLWQRIMTMGHKKVLSNSDVKLLNILYSKQCQNRYLGDT